MVADLEHPSDLNVIVICEKICLCIFKKYVYVLKLWLYLCLLRVDMCATNRDRCVDDKTTCTSANHLFL